MFENATPRPWKCDNKVGYIFARTDGVVVAQCGDFMDAELVPYNAERWSADTALIVHAVNNIEAHEVELATLRAQNAALREALEGLLRVYCSETGFAAAVRADTGLAYPWVSGDQAEATARNALAQVAK